MVDAVNLRCCGDSAVNVNVRRGTTLATPQLPIAVKYTDCEDLIYCLGVLWRRFSTARCE